MVLISSTQFPLSSHISKVISWIPSLKAMIGATIPFTVNSEVWPCSSSPSNDEVHVNVIMSSSKSHDLDALNDTSLCEGNTFWSNGESHMMNGAWFSRGR